MDGLNPADRDRIVRAVQFTERFTREGVNVTPAPEFARPTTAETVVWPVRVTGDLIEEGNPGAGYYPGLLRYPTAAVDGWEDGPDIYILPLAGQTLAAGSEGVGRLLGWSPDPDDPEAEDAVPARLVYAFGVGGVADTVQTVEWDSVTAFDPDTCTVTTTHFTLTLTVSGGVITLGLATS
jgi:hypothetical protein